MSEIMLSMIEYIKDKIQKNFSNELEYEISCPVIMLWGDQSHQVTTIKLDCSQKYWHSILINGLKDYKADSYILTFEAWISNLKSDDPLNKKIFTGEIKVHELKEKDRNEVLIILGSEKGNKPIIWMADIEAIKGYRNINSWQKIEDGSLHLTWMPSNW